jgi:hypothetical protein
MSFLKLSDELLLQIFTPSGPNPLKPKDIKNIILTCRRFYGVALQDVLYRDVQFLQYVNWGHYRYDTTKLARFLHTITVRPELASSVRDIVFRWERSDAKLWQLIFDIIPKLPSIHTLGLHVEKDSKAEAESQVQFSAFLDRCLDVPIRNLWIADEDLTSEYIVKFASIRTIEKMGIYWFNGGVLDSIGLIPNTAPPSNIVKLAFFSARLPSTTVRGPCVPPSLQQFLNLQEPALLKQFPNLQELIWELPYRDGIEFCPIQFVSELRPMKTTLVKLNLSKGPDDGRSDCCSCKLNLSQFMALKVLTLHERLTFKYDWSPGNGWVIEDQKEQELHDDRRGLSERLPPNLEQFEVRVFQHQ